METQVKKKVLYVDDEYPNRITFQITYRNDVDIILADSADDALEILEEEKDIEVVITDLRMPGKSGLDLIREAKITYPDVRFCLLTGFEVTSEIKEALDSKLLEQYFRKPFERSQILDFVKG